MKFLLYGPSLCENKNKCMYVCMYVCRSINQTFQPEVWSFTVKPEQTRLLKYKLFIIWLQIGKAREIEQTSTLPSLSVTISSG